MDTVITVIQVLLGLPLTVGGLLKLTLPYAKYTNMPGVAWSRDFKPEHIRLIGVLEVSGGVGLIVPLLLDSLTMLTPLAAVGIALYMILLANTLREGQPAPDQPKCLPCPAPSAAKADRRVPARGTSISQATARIRLIAVAMIRFWRRVLAIPMYRLRRRSQTRTPWESTPSTPERRA